VAGNAVAAGGRNKGVFVDLNENSLATEPADAHVWGVGADGLWPAFRFVHDLRTGNLLEVSSLVEAAMMEERDTTDSDIEPVNVWMYLGDANADASANSQLAAAGGSANASVFANQPEEGTEARSDSDKIPDGADLDNWPPAGWNGFDKTGLDVPGQGVLGASQKAAGFVDNGVRYATKLIGTDDDDVINGTTGNDFFNGLGGDDVLNGGPGDDAFHFMAGFGNDVVVGFTAGSAGDDTIEFRDGFTSFDDVLAASRQVGPNVLIELDDSNAVALIDVALSSLNQDDFRFV
jgi:RTX calcium-binding nonapeptide repeat (4 copies)